MYKFEISGCLTSLFILLLLLFLVKELWWLIVGIVLLLIVIYYGNLIYKTIKYKKETEQELYNPQMGEVYKVCPYCNSKVKVTAQTCPYCKRALN